MAWLTVEGGGEGETMKAWMASINTKVWGYVFTVGILLYNILFKLVLERYFVVSIIHSPRGWQAIFGSDLIISLWAIIGEITSIFQ